MRTHWWMSVLMSGALALSAGGDDDSSDGDGTAGTGSEAGAGGVAGGAGGAYGGLYGFFGNFTVCARRQQTGHSELCRHIWTAYRDGGASRGCAFGRWCIGPLAARHARY